MKAEEKAEWVAALRSGDYTQAQHRLRIKGGFCCLGVKADLEVKKGNGSWVQKEEDVLADAFYYQLNVDPLNEEEETLTFMGGIPKQIFPETNKYIKDSDFDTFSNHLIRMNDTNKKSLSEIADWIEQNIPED